MSNGPTGHAAMGTKPPLRRPPTTEVRRFWGRLALAVAVSTWLGPGGSHAAVQHPRERVESAPDALHWTTGNWKGTRQAADVPATPVTFVVEPLPTGSGYFERAQVALQPRPYVGFAVRVRGESGRWVMTYGNSNRASLAHLEGTIDGERSSWTDTPAPGARRSRLVFERPAPHRWRRTQLFSDDGGKNWLVLFVDELERA